MAISYAITATPQQIDAPLTGNVVLTNTSTGGDVYLLSNANATSTAAFAGIASALDLLADGLIETNAVLAIPGSVSTFAAVCATGVDAKITVRFGTNLVVST